MVLCSAHRTVTLRVLEGKKLRIVHLSTRAYAFCSSVLYVGTFSRFHATQLEVLFGGCKGDCKNRFLGTILYTLITLTDHGLPTMPFLLFPIDHTTDVHTCMQKYSCCFVVPLCYHVFSVSSTPLKAAGYCEGMIRLQSSSPCAVKPCVTF